jgi:hypothetical protein
MSATSRGAAAAVGMIKVSFPPAVSAMSDKWTFSASVNKNGKKFKYQIMELIKICRSFSMDPQSPHQVVRLQR